MTTCKVERQTGPASKPVLLALPNTAVRVSSLLKKGGGYSYSLTCGGVESGGFSLNVKATLAITTYTLPNANVGQNYSLTFTGSGGTAPYTWSVVSGSLPPGLDLEGPNGILSGKPKQFGTYSFTLQATDSSATPETATAALTMTVNTGLVVNPTTLPPAVISKPYSQAITVSGGITPYTLTIASGACQTV